MKKKEISNLLYGQIIRSYLSSVISISLVLFLVGMAGFLGANARFVSNYFKENIVVSTMLNLEVQEAEALELVRDLESTRYVKSIDYISKERGEMEMEELLGEGFLDVFEATPIPISLDLYITAEYMAVDSLEMIVQEIMQYSQVSEVVYQKSLVDVLNANIEKFALAFTILIGVLLIISFVLINNTVRLNVYSKRFIIRTMRLVGATKYFIVKPFIGNAFFQGFISSLLAVTALLAVVYLIREEFHQLFMMIDDLMLFYVIIGVILIGITICIVSTLFVVRKMITLKKDELY